MIKKKKIQKRKLDTEEIDGFGKGLFCTDEKVGEAEVPEL
jgi:hypothetical protein